MKLVTPLIIAATLLLAAGARSQNAAAVEKPYASIVARNMFSLVPIPTNDPAAEAVPKEPPPKITPNGIMTLFGHLQALFKVAIPKGKPGQPAKDQAYVLSEGERQDEIEVLKINQQDRIITFNNHGIIQELPLVASSATTGAPGAGAAGMASGAVQGGNPAMNALRQNMAAAAERAAALRRSTGRGATPSSPGMPENPSNPAGQNLINGEMNERRIYQPPVDPNPMTPEQSAFLIEAQRKVYEEQGNPMSNLMPPTRGDAQRVIQQISDGTPQQ